MKINQKNSLIALVMALTLGLPAFAAGEPGNVSNVVVKAKDATTLTVSWDAVKDSAGNPVDHYKLYYGPESVQQSQAAVYEVEVETPTNAATYDLTGLKAETTYYVAVTAFDSSDMESVEYSIEASGKPSNTPSVETASDTVAPTVLNVVAADKNHVLVGFSEKVVLPTLIPEAAFMITEQANTEKMLEVVSAKMFADDANGKTVLLETVNQTVNVNYLLTVSASVRDEADNAIESGNTDSGVFLGSKAASSTAVTGTKTPTVQELAATNPVATENPSAEDLLLDNTTPTSNTNETPGIENTDSTAPEDVTNLVLTFKEQLQKFAIVMNWEASLNTAKDLADQIIYMSTDLGATFDTGKSVGATDTNYELGSLEGGKEYTIKLATVDQKGNESVGVVKSIRLPSTGFGAGFLILGSAYGAHKMLKRRKQKMAQNG